MLVYELWLAILSFLCRPRIMSYESIIEQFAFTEFLKSRSEYCWQLLRSCTRELGISDNTKDINPKWIPRWNFEKKTEMKIKISSQLSKTLEPTEQKNTITIIQQCGSVKIQTLFAYQQDIWTLAVWLMLYGLDRKGTTRIESQIAALCNKKAQKCVDLICWINKILVRAPIIRTKTIDWK